MKIEITPEAVKAAYEKTGLNPMRTDFYIPDTQCACGLSALALSCDPKVFDEPIAERFGYIGHIMHTLDITERQAWGFIYGFDASENLSDGDPEFYEIGLAAGSLIFES